ncbi:RNA-directed DNA polymerase, eukaryota, reverse transcriptase zinc-binding domain protein, partial [Tanacetum coccineum]
MACTACHIECRSCDKNCMFRGIAAFSFDNQGQANFKALREVYGVDYLSSILMSKRDAITKDAYIRGLLSELGKQKRHIDGGASETIKITKRRIAYADQENRDAMIRLGNMR